MIEKYGLPHEVGATAIVWHNNGPWKRTIVYRDEVPHSFPKPHTDLLEQVIDARVPPDKFDDLANYDGSVHAHRTQGELSARCDMEEMNFLALNLANDVATGKKSVEEARAAYTKSVMEFMTGEKPPAYTGPHVPAGEDGGQRSRQSHDARRAATAHRRSDTGASWRCAGDRGAHHGEHKRGAAHELRAQDDEGP